MATGEEEVANKSNNFDDISYGWMHPKQKLVGAGSGDAVLRPAKGHSDPNTASKQF